MILEHMSRATGHAGAAVSREIGRLTSGVPDTIPAKQAPPARRTQRSSFT
jgi:hypothetical protein